MIFLSHSLFTDGSSSKEIRSVEYGDMPIMGAVSASDTKLLPQFFSKRNEFARVIGHLI